MAVGFDAATHPTGDEPFSATTWTYSHTCGASATLLLVYVAGFYNIGSNDHATGVTYNGTSMTKLAQTDNPTSGACASIWYLENPDTGAAHDVVITFAGSVNAKGSCAISHTGAGIPENLQELHDYSRSPPTYTLTITSETDGLIVGFLSTDNASVTADGALTVRVEHQDNVEGHHTADRAGAASADVEWTSVQDGGSLFGFSLPPAGGVVVPYPCHRHYRQHVRM